MKFTLRPVYKTDYQFLYNLLSDRNDYENISHHAIPTYEEHSQFWENVPYKDDYIILIRDIPVGMAYVSYKNEVGIHFIKDKENNKIRKDIINTILNKFKGEQLFFNVSSKNKPYIRLLRRMKFNLIEHTYATNIL